MSGHKPDPLLVLAGNIERLMLSRDLSIDQLAATAGIARDRVEAFLGCTTEATAEDLIRLAGALRVQPGRLLDGAD